METLIQVLSCTFHNPPPARVARDVDLRYGIRMLLKDPGFTVSLRFLR